MRIFVLALSTLFKIHAYNEEVRLSSGNNGKRPKYPPRPEQLTCPSPDKPRMLPEKENVRLRKVLMLYVGGTIGMVKNMEGVLESCRSKFLEKLKYHSQMHDPESAHKYFGEIKENQLVLPPIENDIVMYEMLEYTPLLDSSNMSLPDWVKIARDIARHYKDYDGFVVLHGTDTLAYTSSALAFLLENLQKPVILTGAQIPIFETRSDAKDNILGSLIFAGCFDIPEVCIFFGYRLLRGCRTVKSSSTHLDAFHSPNYHHLAEVSIDIEVYDHYVRRSPSVKNDSSCCPLKAHYKMNPNVTVLKIFPTITAAMVRAVLQPPVEGLVIESFGSGNIPSHSRELLEVLSEGVKRGVLILNITQCPQGTVSPLYAAGKALEDIGVICGHDMTSEAALTKLCFILGRPNLTYEERVEMAKANLRGELTRSQ